MQGQRSEISEVQIIPIKPANGLIALANIVYDGNLFLGSIGIHKKLNGYGYRLTFPTKKLGDKSWNIYHPINKTTSKLIEDAIIEEAERLFQ